MVFRKYKPIKQWGKMDTRIFKEILNSRNNRKMPGFQVPEAVKALNVEIHDPNKPGFFTPIIGNVGNTAVKVEHPAFRAPPIEDHPLYHNVRCFLFEGKDPMSDGMAQACALSKAILREGIPENILSKVENVDIGEEAVKDSILHAEKYEPTLEKLPRRFDPVLFWVKHPRVYGTPVERRNQIILDNLLRHIIFAGICSKTLPEPLRFDRKEPISALLNSAPHFHQSPFVLRFQPYLTVITKKPLKAWVNEQDMEKLSTEPVADVSPISPLIDLGSDHVYNDTAHVTRPNTNNAIHTLLWTRIQDQKYPWTTEQNAANAILHTFGAAVAEATRSGNKRDLKKNPVVVNGVQLVDGKFDLVTFQLNTLDLSNENPVKNVVWVEKAARLYRPKPFYEQLETLEHVEMGTVKKLTSLILQ